MVKSADTADLKSADLNRSWGFKSPSGHDYAQSLIVMCRLLKIVVCWLVLLVAILCFQKMSQQYRRRASRRKRAGAVDARAWRAGILGAAFGGFVWWPVRSSNFCCFLSRPSSFTFRLSWVMTGGCAYPIGREFLQSGVVPDRIVELQIVVDKRSVLVDRGVGMQIDPLIPARFARPSRYPSQTY